MKKQIIKPVSRRGFVAGTTALAGTLGFPAILGAQPAAVKVGMIHPVTGFVAYNGQQGRLGGTMAIEDINKAGGIKSMGGAKLEALLGDSQSKVEVGVAEVEKMNEQGVAAYIGCFQSPVGIAASQAASKYNTPFLIDVGASDLAFPLTHPADRTIDADYVRASAARLRPSFPSRVVRKLRPPK